MSKREKTSKLLVINSKCNTIAWINIRNSHFFSYPEEDSERMRKTINIFENNGYKYIHMIRFHTKFCGVSMCKYY